MAGAAALLWLALAAAPARGKPAAGKAPPARRPAQQQVLLEPVQLSGDVLELRQDERTALYTGHVVAVRKDATLRCDTLTGWFDEANQPLRFECVGRVEAVQQDTKVEGERAEFDNATGVVVVTGNPRATRGGVRVTGRRFRFDTVRDELLGDDPATVSDSPGSAGKPVTVRARTVRVDNARGTAVWTGDVRVLRDGATLRCTRLVARSAPDGTLTHAACTGSARLDMAERWAEGERADYDVPSARVFVTGNPRAGDGVNLMNGTRFVVDVEQRLMVGENVRARLDPAASKARQPPKGEVRR
jgi:lipopolysaccharide export system protein LptA